MKYWRTIIIEDETYRWRYVYDDMDFANYPFSYLLICPCENSKNEIRIIFKRLVPPMLLPGAKGELAVKNGMEIFINLHEPKFIREIMDYLLHGVVDFHTKQKWVFDPGEVLLNTLGYSF